MSVSNPDAMDKVLFEFGAESVVGLAVVKDQYLSVANDLDCR